MWPKLKGFKNVALSNKKINTTPDYYENKPRRNCSLRDILKFINIYVFSEFKTKINK